MTPPREVWVVPTTQPSGRTVVAAASFDSQDCVPKYVRYVLPTPLLTDDQRQALEASRSNHVLDDAQWDTLEALFTEMGVWPSVPPALLGWLLAMDARGRA